MADPLDDSILTSIKAALGLAEDYEPYDVELAMHINAALATLHQLGVGPADGFAITGKTEKWSGLLDDNLKLLNVKSYVFKSVKIIFDASSMSQHLLAAYQKLMEEDAWRIQAAADPMIPQLVPEVEEI